MKEFWLEKRECTGCGACANICPVDALSMKSDCCGFAYPDISKNCINCGMCQKVCEKRINAPDNNFKKPDTYAVWSKDNDVRYFSTSGGAFSELARVILRRHGYVAGALYNEDNLVEHSIICDEAGLEKIRQSKYIQSDAGNIYRQIKDKLSENKLVAFCGAPCQISALYAFLGKDYDNLITIDFICRGMNSPKAYKSWLQEIEKEEKKKVKKVWFKYKSGGWKKSPRCTRIDFEDGSYKVYDGDENVFMTGYLGANLYIRQSCGECQFKGLPRRSDITLADFWGIEKELDDDMGTSMVLVNTEKGMELFSAASSAMNVHKRNIDEIYAGNVCLNGSVKINKKSENFLKSLDRLEFSKAVKKYEKITLFERVCNKLRRIK